MMFEIYQDYGRIFQFILNRSLCLERNHVTVGNIISLLVGKRPYQNIEFIITLKTTVDSTHSTHATKGSCKVDFLIIIALPIISPNFPVLPEEPTLQHL